jgi:2'-5' RNA ligase
VARADELTAEVFSLQLDRLEYWPAPRALVAVARHVPLPCEALVRALGTLATDFGVKPEARPWRAHVTLARGVPRGQLPAELLGAPELPQKVMWEASSFLLAESRTPSGHAATGEQRYWPLHSWPLVLKRP